MTCPLCPFKGCPECQHQGGKDPTKMPTLSAPDDKLEAQTKAAPAGNRGLTTTTNEESMMAKIHDSRPRDHRGHFRKAAVPQSVRREVALRAGGIPGQTVAAECSYCGAPGKIFWPMRQPGIPGAWVAFPDLELDHVIPEFSGGPATADNIVLACRPCNRRKGHR